MRLNSEPVDLGPDAGIASFISGGDGSPSAEPFLTRGRAPAVLRLSTITLAPGDVLHASVEFDTRFLPLGDFPPDPNYGFDMNPVELEVLWLLRRVCANHRYALVVCLAT